jgi:hypothetical protein
MACLHLKAVAHALGERNLPTIAVQRVLEGFAKSSTSSLNKFCTSQIALHCGSLYDKLMSNNSLQTQLNDVLNDLESTYLDLVGGKLWAGVNASPTKSSFVAGSTKDDEIKDAKALAALKKIPFDEWAKLHAVCHHCGEKGHIRPHYPKYIGQVKLGGLKPPSKARPCVPPVAQRPGLPNPRRDYSKNQKQKQSGQLPSKPYSTTIASTT